MKKKPSRKESKTQFFERQFTPHPAAASAESDAIKLMRELEALRKQHEELATRTNESRDSIEAARIEFNMIVTRHHGIIDAARRMMRVVEVQINNVEELLAPLVGRRDDRGAESQLSRTLR